MKAGIGDVVVTDRAGVLHSGRTDLTDVKRDIAMNTNHAGRTGTLEEALAGADVFIGVSGGTVPEAAVATLAEGAFIFAMANPTPEIHPDVAHKYASVVATGRSDYPNQINNVLAFPGIFAGALRVRASRITPGMKIAAADALASLIAEELRPDHIIPSPFDPRVAPAVAEAVAEAARRDGVARV
ncbi:Malic enzyme, NAD binding domain [Streptomyces sp. OV198]|nr:Malic enzyme, NAD binding domain [Streptomyces sp. OV198]